MGKKNDWMHEPRTWVVYAMTPHATAVTGWKWTVGQAQKRKVDGVEVYLGITSFELDRRLREHEADAYQRSSPCPLHAAMRRNEGRWYILPLQRLKSSTYQQARAVERKLKAEYAGYPGLELLNRKTLRC